MDFSFLDDWTEEETKAPPIEEVGTGYRNVWVVAETDRGVLTSSTLETVGQARELADQIGVYAHAVLLGTDGETLSQQLIAYGADRVLCAPQPVLLPYSPAIQVSFLADLVAQHRPEILLLPATPLGNDLAPCLAQRLGTGLISHCIRLEIDMSERLLLGTTPVLGGEMYRTYACPQARPQMATLEPGYFSQPYEDAYRTGRIDIVDLEPDLPSSGQIEWLALRAKASLPQVPLSQAPIVVAGGRGMGDEEGFAVLQELAQAIGAALAGSRGAYDEGWIGEDRIVGVAGQSIAPNLYIACGIAGDVYHAFGARDARFILAINTSVDAPIMKTANMAVVGDAREIVPEILKALAS